MCFVLGCVCWLGSFDVMCLGVPKGSWLVHLARHIGWGWSCPGRPWLWLELAWLEAQPEFAGLGLAVCVEAGFGVVGAPGPKVCRLQGVCGKQLVGALQCLVRV